MRTKDLANGLAYFTDELEFRADDLIKAINATLTKLYSPC